jgi:hypothetical protein
MPLRKIFCSYASVDEALRSQLEQHLALLKHERLVETWTFRDIDAGEEWRKLIHRNLETSHIVVLPVSAAFLASDYCFNIEMKRALELHASGRCVVVPIIVRPCDWKTAPFADLQALPDKARPVTTWRHRDRAWLSVVDGLRNVIQTLQTLSPHTNTEGPIEPVHEKVASLLATPLEMRASSGASVVTTGQHPRLVGAELGPVGLEFEITNPARLDLSIRTLSVDVVEFEDACLLRTLPYMAAQKTRRYNCTVEPEVGRSFACTPVDTTYDFIKLASGELERFGISVDAYTPGRYRLAITVRYSFGGTISELSLTAPKRFAFLGPSGDWSHALTYLQRILNGDDVRRSRQAALELGEIHEGRDRYRHRHEVEGLLRNPKVHSLLTANLQDPDEWVRWRTEYILKRLQAG